MFAKGFYNVISLRTLGRINVEKVRRRSEDDLLQNDCEAVDVSFLSSVARTTCQTQQLRGCPHLTEIKLIISLLSQQIYTNL